MNPKTPDRQPGVSLLRCATILPNDAVAGVLDKVESQLEGVAAAIVGVGHGGISGVARHEVGGAHQLAALLRRARQAAESLHVVAVHAEDDVETREVARPYLPCPAVYAVAAGRPVAAHTRVGQLPLVPRAYAGGVDRDAARRPVALLQLFPHYGLGRRRAADVAEADKKYLVFFIVIQ